MSNRETMNQKPLMNPPKKSGCRSTLWISFAQFWMATVSDSVDRAAWTDKLEPAHLATYS